LYILPYEDVAVEIKNSWRGNAAKKKFIIHRRRPRFYWKSLKNRRGNEIVYLELIFILQDTEPFLVLLGDTPIENVNISLVVFKKRTQSGS
jgi:hypothetical protein